MKPSPYVCGCDDGACLYCGGTCDMFVHFPAILICDGCLWSSGEPKHTAALMCDDSPCECDYCKAFRSDPSPSQRRK